MNQQNKLPADLNLIFRVAMTFEKGKFQDPSGEEELIVNFTVSVDGWKWENTLTDVCWREALPFNENTENHFDLIREYMEIHLLDQLHLQTEQIIHEARLNALEKTTGKKQKELASWITGIRYRMRWSEVEEYRLDFLEAVLQQADSREKILDRRGGKDSKANINLLYQHFQEIYPDWKKAGKIYKDSISSKSYQKQKDWLLNIEEAFPEFPTDLILRLQPIAKWSDEILIAISDQGGESNPKDIALEHAARLCGAAPYAYRLASLKKYLTNQKRVIKTQK